MKSYLLFGTSNIEGAAAELDRRLPGQQSPWLLRDPGGDIIAYFDIEPTNLEFEGPDDPNGAGPLVQANISGRHYNEDAAVVSILRQVQVVAGGYLKNDNNELI